MWGVLNANQTAILEAYGGEVPSRQPISSTAFLLLKVTSVGACTAASIAVGKIGSGGKQLRTMVYNDAAALFGARPAEDRAFFPAHPLLRILPYLDETRYHGKLRFSDSERGTATMSYQMPTNAGILRGGGDTKGCAGT